LLIEAGRDKIPNPKTVGNELSIFKPYDDKAIWGNISRNTFLAMKFAQYINPNVKIDSVKYSKGLIFRLRIIGCVKVN